MCSLIFNARSFKYSKRTKRLTDAYHVLANRPTLKIVNESRAFNEIPQNVYLRTRLSHL